MKPQRGVFQNRPVAAPEYRFLDEWLVQHPIEAVYDLMADVHGYPAWWGDVWVSTTGHSGPPWPGTGRRSWPTATCPTTPLRVRMRRRRPAAPDRQHPPRRLRRIGLAHLRGGERRDQGRARLPPTRQQTRRTSTDAAPAAGLPLEPCLGDATGREAHRRAPPALIRGASSGPSRIQDRVVTADQWTNGQPSVVRQRCRLQPAAPTLLLGSRSSGGGLHQRDSGAVPQARATIRWTPSGRSPPCLTVGFTTR